MSEGGFEVGGLTIEERWVPVAESGDRWTPRDKESALRCLAEYPAGGCYADGEPWDGVTHVEREIRYVTKWRFTLREDRP